MFENNYDKIVSDTMINTEPRDKSFQGLQKGQIVKRKIHRGKENHRYVASTQVFVLQDEEITGIDNRIILIENENLIDDNLLEKFGQFKIIQVRKTCYVAVLESIIEE
jgi:hypothetical protein